MLGGEPVRIGADVAGRVTSGGYGYSVERSIAYAYLPLDAAPGTSVDIDVFGRWVGADVVPEPPIDAANRRVRS